MEVYNEEGFKPIKSWVTDIEEQALTQAKNLTRLPFIASNSVALMPDFHTGSQFTAHEFLRAVKEQGCKPSIGREG